MSDGERGYVGSALAAIFGGACGVIYGWWAPVIIAGSYLLVWVLVKALERREGR